MDSRQAVLPDARRVNANLFQTDLCQNPGSMDEFELTSPSMALDTRFPTGMTSLRINDVKVELSPIPQSHNIWGSQYRLDTRGRDTNTNLPLRKAVYTGTFSISYPCHFLRPVQENCIATWRSIVSATRVPNPVR